MTPEDVRAIVEALRETVTPPVSIDLSAVLAGGVGLLVLVLGWFVRRLVGTVDGVAAAVAALAKSVVTHDDCNETRRHAREEAERVERARRDAVAEATEAAAAALALARRMRERGEDGG